MKKSIILFLIFATFLTAMCIAYKTQAQELTALRKSTYEQMLIEDDSTNSETLYLFYNDSMDYPEYFVKNLSVSDSMLCAERGHISGFDISRTLMYCPPETIDYPDSTVVFYPSCNYYSYTCRRCHKYITEMEPSRQVTIWRRKK